MRSLIHGLLFLCGVALASLVEVDDSNFENLVFGQPGKYSFVYFYAPGCKHCLELEPHFEPLVDLYEGTKLQIFKINGRTNKRIRDKYQLFGYPTLKLFSSQGDDIGAYTGIRTTAKMIEYLEDATGIHPIYPPRTVVEVSPENIEQEVFEKLQNDVMLVFYAPWVERWDNAHNSFYERLAQYYENEVKDGTLFRAVDVSKAENNALLAQFKVAKYPTLFYFPKNRQDSNSPFRLDHNVGPEEIVEILMGSDTGQRQFTLVNSLDFTEVEENTRNDEVDVQYRDL
ncbi:hypothetical protein KL935_000798 [Ogataea polymorpha]|nr:hypothetical protein KL935_000798 [Ogataea polymorpha]